MKDITGTTYISSFKNPKGRKYYIVQKSINGKRRHFGTGSTLIEALMIRDWCKANNWRKQYPRSATGERHICKVNGSFRIQKWINGKLEYFGTFKSLKNAVKERDLLLEYNWDLEVLCELN